MLVLGIGYKARHGKNFTARAIIEHCSQQGLYAKEYGFADALKAYCRVLGMRKKDPRLLQLVGSDVFRTLDPDIWVRVLLDTIDEQQPDVALITDMRFPNEVDAIVKFGGKLIKVSRTHSSQDPTLHGTPWVAGDRDPNHPSEIALDGFTGWDYEISNADGDVVGLRARAVRAFQILQGSI